MDRMLVCLSRFQYESSKTRKGMGRGFGVIMSSSIEATEPASVFSQRIALG
jgi:hypothetical protein